MTTTAGSFEPLPRPPLVGRDDAALAAADGQVLLFGGMASGAKNAAADGAVYDFSAAKWSAVPDWPYAPPYAPGVVAIGNGRFVVVGMPCPERAEEQDETVCGQPLASDSATGSWSKLPAPKLHRAKDEHAAVVAHGYGLSAGHALFTVNEGDTIVVVAFDVARQAWSRLAFPPGFALQDYESKSDDDGDPDGGASNASCFVAGHLIAARVSVVHATVLTWTLDANMNWWSGTDLPLPALGQLINELHCTGGELLLMLAGARGDVVDHIEYFDSTSSRWVVLPTPPTRAFEAELAVVRVNGSWLVWPNRATGQHIYTLAAGAHSWTTGKIRIAGPVQLFVQDDAVLVRSAENATPHLALYGI